MTSRSTHIAKGFLFALGLAALACGSDDAEDNNNSGTPDAGPDATQDAANEAAPDAPTGDAAEDVNQPDVEHEAGPCTDVTSISGSAVDESDAPLAGAAAIVCIYYGTGTSKCLQPKQTSADGTFTVDMPEGSVCLDTAAYQMKSFDDLSVVGVYCPVDISGGGDVVVSEPTKLVVAPACTRDALGDTTQPHEIVSPDGVTMRVVPDELWLFDYTYEEMRVAAWDDAAWGWPCFIDPSNPPDGLAAFAPEIEVKSEDALHISFPNDAGLAAGTVVDLYALGGAATETWSGKSVHEGEWAVIGEAEVSSDGTRIETRAGEGLPFGTWVGWKQK